LHAHSRSAGRAKRRAAVETETVAAKLVEGGPFQSPPGAPGAAAGG
jgi:hypothetical protein